MTVRIAPQMMLMVIEVCIRSFALSGWFEPMYLAKSTLAPTDRPINRLVSRLINALVEPTAARAMLPA